MQHSPHTSWLIIFTPFIKEQSEHPYREGKGQIATPVYNRVSKINYAVQPTYILADHFHTIQQGTPLKGGQGQMAY